jgi:hypothetical protein
MNVRATCVTALTLLALAAPVAQATIPSDHEGVRPSTPHKSIPPTRQPQKLLPSCLLTKPISCSVSSLHYTTAYAVIRNSL